MRHHPTLMVFAASVLAVFGALAWVTRHALSLERQQRESRAQAQVQERVRLALWRMDSKASVLMARESARPYFEYQPFYATDRAYTRMLEEVRAGEVLVPSPLLTLHDRFVKLYFQIDTHGVITSPQAPAGNLRDLAEASYVASTDVIEATGRLEELASLMGTPGTTEGEESDRRAGLYCFTSGGAASPADSGVEGLRRPNLSPEAAAPAPVSTPTEFDDASVDAMTSPTGTAPPKPASNAPTQRSQVPEQQSLTEYRARVSAAEAVKETAQVEAQNSVRGQSRQTVQATGADSPSDKPATKSGRSMKTIPAAGAAEDAKEPAPSPKSEVTPPDSMPAQTVRIDNQQFPPPAASTLAAKDATAAKDKSDSPQTTSAAGDQNAARVPGPPASGPSRPATVTGMPGSAGANSGNLADVDRERISAPDVADLLKQGPAVGGETPADADMQPSSPPPTPDAEEAGVEVGSFSASWIVPHGVLGTVITPVPQLLLFRDVHLGGAVMRQGCWVDWPALRADLLASVRDLLPKADLIPVTAIMAEGGDNLGQRLASFPAELAPGEVQVAAMIPLWTPLHNTLLLAWAGVLLAIAAIAALLRAATDLAERRGRFVSAVTHELRTPLTTFVMYSQMLADGMVPEGEARQHYYSTLKREASRLAGIVENVLEFARLSRKKRTRSAATNGPMRASELLERLTVPLRQRAQQAGMSLEVSIDASEHASSQLVTTEELTIERILFNLVDNACKYGSSGGPGTITLRMTIDDTVALFTVSDDGPGISAIDRARIFKAFERGEKQADGSIPGLGLGLALSRGLARDLGGDLSLTSSSPATFELRVPRH